jgi:hypothetical protein
MRKSKLVSNAEGDEACSKASKCKLSHGDDVDFDVFAIRLANKDHERDWEMRLTYPTVGVWPNGIYRRAKWTPELLIEKLQSTLRLIRSIYIGDWVLSVRKSVRIPDETDRRPGAQVEAERRILAGPDGPGRRYLIANGRSLAPKIKSVPPAVQCTPIATRKDIETLVDRVRHLPPAPSPIMADDAFWAQPVESDDPADKWQHGD